MKNTTELRDELRTIYADVKSGKIGIKEAKMLISTVNAMLKSANSEMEYSKFQGTKNTIPFLETPPEKK